MDNGQSTNGATDLLTATVPVSCIGCGHVLDMNAKFCPECGVARVVAPAPPASAATMTPPPTEDTGSTVTPPETPTEPELTLPLPTTEAHVAAATEPVELQTMPTPDVEPTERAQEVQRRSYRRWTLYGLLVLLVVAAVVAGMFAYAAMQRRPLVAALALSSQEFASAVKEVATAEDLAALTDVAEELPGWIRPIETQADFLRSKGSGGLAAAASNVAAAQAAYLVALQPLADLDPTKMEDWPEISEAIAAATADLEGSAAELRAVDPAAVGDASFGVEPATAAVETAVALTTADNATARVREVIALVAGAQRLDAVRAAGGAASAASLELQAALSTLEDLAEADAAVERLALEAAFLDELSGLEDLTDTTLGSWSTASATVAERADAMVEALALSPSERSGVRADLRGMRANIDALVAAGKKELAQWRRDVERVKTQRDVELAALAAYESGYRTQMERYNDLRDSTADFTERIREDFGVTYDEAYSAFYDGISQREEVRESMNGLAPPDSVRSHHLAVVGVIDDAIAAMQAAVDGLSDSQFCYFDCYYEDTAGWQRFQAESERITDEFGDVTSAWDAAVSARRSELENLELPKKPEL